MSIDAARTVLVVVPTLNEVRTIEAVLRSLRNHPSLAVDVMTVIVDGGSTDGTVDLVKRLAADDPGLRLIDNPRRIQSAAVNLAVQRHGANADVLVRCDAHARYPTGYVQRLLDTLDRTGADSVVVPMDSRGTTCFQKAVAWVSNTWAGTGGSAHRGGQRSGFVDHGHHAAFRMDAFRRAGGYDESFTHNEDAELDCRQRSLGGKIYLDADIRLGYEPRATVGSLARQYFAYGRGRSRTVRRHPKSMRLRQLAVPVHVAVSCLALALASWWPLLLIWPLIYLGVLALTSVGIVVGKRSLCGIFSGIAAVVMHTSWAAGFLSGLALLREDAWRPPPMRQSAPHL
jgi:succinoglycan biosynthesis protein ExoA